jgi:probable rRNA maturation factor
VRDASPRIAFEEIARLILSERYDLSLVVCGDSLAERVNRRYRLPALKFQQAGKKDYAPNILSFPLGIYEGEMFLNVRAAAREAKKYGVPLKERLELLFVHGCLHLKGLRHGRTMEATEQKILRAFRIV